jgi:methionyl aminopeptidase
VCHGIPDDRPLEDGDSLNIDVSVFFNGHHGDCSTMFTVGGEDDEGNRLIHTARHSLDEAISICKPGVPYKEIGQVIQ